MNKPLRWALFGIAGSMVAVIAFVFSLGEPVDANPVAELYLDLASPLPPGATMPPDCSTWHELWPTWNDTYHQDAYNDANGDSVVSVGDEIILDGWGWQVSWVGPTYFLTCLDNSEQVVYESFDPGTGGNPICEDWHEIHPHFCNTAHVESWVDMDGSGDLSPCDEVDWFDPDTGTNRVYHLDRIGLNVRVYSPVAVEETTWGEIKSFFAK